MKKNTYFFTIVFIIILLFSAFSLSHAQVPEKLKSMIGIYKGEWTMYGMNKEGNIVERIAWTDKIEMQDPVVKDGKAYAITIDKMTFKGNIPPQEIKGKEGYYLNEDGSLGDYFIEMQGQEIISHEIGKDVWIYSAPVSTHEYAFLGFSNVFFGKHVLVKVISRKNGNETHRISRVTTIGWMDDSNKGHWIQFVSLKGFHERQS
ncbi:MAG: hypothetical protein JXB26_08375 [Candidatus Aminicenantes bacterium]|nr:hypothetical protein [Candidatus Aminicenantes bacterium]